MGRPAARQHAPRDVGVDAAALRTDAEVPDAMAAAAPLLAAEVWDLPTRVSHWTLVACVAGAWATAELGRMDLHASFGCAVLGLVVFRVYWGCLGSSTARFVSFVRGPRAIVAYLPRMLSRAPSRTAGHNPIAGHGAVVLLSVTLAHVCLGLVAVDVDGLDSGPLSHWVDFDTGRSAARGHARTFDLLSVIVAVHVASVLFYLIYKRENLIRPMVTGRAYLHQGAVSAVRRAPLWLALPGVALAAAMVWLIRSS